LQKDRGIAVQSGEQRRGRQEVFHQQDELQKKNSGGGQGECLEEHTFTEHTLEMVTRSLGLWCFVLPKGQTADIVPAFCPCHGGNLF